MADFYRDLAGLGEALAWGDPSDDKVAEGVASRQRIVSGKSVVNPRGSI